MTHFTDLPCAISGLKSYRYLGQFGYVMIGANDTPEALREAERSITGKAIIARLEFWNGQKYQSCE